MKQMITLILVIFSNLTFAQYSPTIYPVLCDDNELLSNFGTVIYRFSFSKDCLKALEDSRMSGGHFCDDDKIILPSGHVFHDFNWSSQCQEALSALSESRAGLFCDGTSMFQVRLGLITSHGFESHCKQAIKEARDYRGLFCKDGLMMDQWGRSFRDYGFRSSCVEALKKLTF